MPKVSVHFLLTAFIVSVLCVRAAVACETNEAALHAQIESLKQQIARQEALVTELTQKTQVLAPTQASSGKALAVATDKRGAQNITQLAPSSTLGWERAVKAASAVRYMVSGSSLMTVMPTGSMKPLFDERAILIMEPAPYDELKVGDIITYLHPLHKMPVVHRISEKRTNGYYTQGDNNSRADEIQITRDNYQARVFGIIYAKEAPQAQ